jgi:hypothetical protein
MSSIWVRTVIFVGEQWGATGSHMTGSDVTGSHTTGNDPVRNHVMRMRNREFRNTYWGLFTGSDVSDRVRMCNRYILYYY